MSGYGHGQPEHRWANAKQRDLRRQRLALLDQVEKGLLAIIAEPGPTVVDGEIVYGQDGEPVPNRDVGQYAERLLWRVRRQRVRLLGETPER
jgi:hypothetical protein